MRRQTNLVVCCALFYKLLPDCIRCLRHSDKLRLSTRFQTVRFTLLRRRMCLRNLPEFRSRMYLHRISLLVLAVRLLPVSILNPLAVTLRPSV